MATGQEKVNIYLKKFLPQQQMVDNFLDYLRNQDIENLKLQYPLQGFFLGNSLAGLAADTLRAATPSLATDGQGNILKLDPTEADFTFENENAIPYHVGMRYNVLETGTEINVRTGQIEYTFFKDAIGEKAEPLSIVDNGSTITLNVDSLFEAGVDNTGRKVIVYLKRAIGQADAFYEGVVYFSGGSNLIDTTHLIGQTAGLVSIDPADYWGFAPGPTVKRNTNLSLDPVYVYYGIVTGGGAGTTPTAGQIDTTLSTLLFGGGAFGTLVDMGRSFLVGGGSISWDLANEQLTWSADLRLKIASRPFDYQMIATTITLLDGECYYIDADGFVGGIKTALIADLPLVPQDPTAQPIALRIGNDIYFRDGALELEGDTIENTVTIGRLDGTTKDTLDYMGSKNESDSTPDYTNALGSAIANIFLTDNDNLTKSIKTLELRDDVVTKVRVIDWLSSALPELGNPTAPVIDGQTLINGDRALFVEAGLSGVYQVSGIGAAVVWTKLPVFGGALVPDSLSLIGVKDSADEFIRTVYQWTAANGWKPLDTAEIEGEPSGFINRTSSTFSFDDGTRTFTLEPKAPSTYFYYGQRGLIFRVESQKTVVIPDAEGLHYIYFDGATLVSTQVFDSDIILRKTIVATVTWDAVNKEAILLAEERHGLEMDGMTHLYLHLTNGCQYATGLGMSGNIAGDGSDDAHAQVAVDGGSIYDEDLAIEIVDGQAESLDIDFQQGVTHALTRLDAATKQLAQGFLHPSVDPLSKITLKFSVGGNPTGPHYLEVFDDNAGKPGVSQGVSDSIEMGPFSAAHEVDYIFPAHLNLTLGQLYHFVVKSPGGTFSGGGTDLFAYFRDTGDAYGVAGEHFNDSTDTGASWTTDTDRDLWFKLYTAPITLHAQTLSPIAQIPIYHKDGAGGNWRKDTATDFPFKASAAPLFNNPAGPWTEAAVQDTYFFASYIMATNDINEPIIAIMGQREDVDLANAQQNNTIDTLNLDGLPTLEFKALYRIIYEYNVAFTSGSKVRQVEFTDHRFTESAGGTGVTPSDHNALSGRSSLGSHPTQAISTTPSDFGGAGSAKDLEVKTMLKTLDDHFKALRIHEHPSNKDRVILTGASVALNTGTVLEQQLKNLIVAFDGIQIDFGTGEIFEDDGATPFNGGANDFTPVIPPVGEDRWAAITMLPSTVNVDNTINIQPLVLISESDNFRGVFASGIKVGQVKLEEDTGSIADILQAVITQQGVGGGGGDGAGDANSFLEDLKDRARIAFWRFFTPFIFATQEAEEEDSVNTTANFDIANGEYDFSLGEILATINQFGSRFLGTSATLKPEADQDLAKVEIWAQYTDGAEDPAPIARVSRDGRNEFQLVSMVQHGNSGLWTGEHVFEEEAANQNLHELPVADADTQALFTDSGAGAKRAFQFVVTDKEAQKELTLYLQKTGSPLGKARVNVIRDDTSLPSLDPADVLGVNESGFDIDIAALSAGNNVSLLPIGRVITRPGTYWVEVITDQVYKDSYVAATDELGLRVDTAGTAPDGAVYDDGPGTWAATASEAAVYLLEGMQFDLRVEIEASANDVSLKAMGTFYAQRATKVQQGLKLRHVERFSGSLDTTEFNIPAGKFLPDPDQLEIFDVGSGQVYKYPAFGVDGHKITFEPGQFLNPGEEIILIFDQSKGVGFDNSDVNSALMAANRLGSTDPTIDKSIAGGGILLRADNGTLVEASLSWTGAVYEWVFVVA